MSNRCGLCGERLGTANHICQPKTINVYSEDMYNALQAKLHSAQQTIEAQAKEIERLGCAACLGEPYHNRHTCSGELEKENAELRAEIERLVKAQFEFSRSAANMLNTAVTVLRWYADETNYDVPLIQIHNGEHRIGRSDVQKDGGERARQALSHIKGGQTNVSTSAERKLELLRHIPKLLQTKEEIQAWIDMIYRDDKLSVGGEPDGS